MKWGSTSSPHIGDVMMSLFFTLGSIVHDWGWPKMVHFGPKMVKHGRLVNPPKWSKGAQKGPNGQPKSFWTFGTLLGPSGPFWTISNNNWYFAPKHLCKTLFCPFGAKNHFCLKWSKRVQMDPNGVPNDQKTQVDHFSPFWAPLDHFGALTSLPCLAIFGPKWTIFGPSPVMNGQPQSKKKAHHHVSYVWPACGTPNIPFWNINMVAINEKCQK